MACWSPASGVLEPSEWPTSLRKPREGAWPRLLPVTHTHTHSRTQTLKFHNMLLPPQRSFSHVKNASKRGCVYVCACQSVCVCVQFNQMQSHGVTVMTAAWLSLARNPGQMAQMDINTHTYCT